MSNKQVYEYKDVREKILHAVDLISDPIRGTISPKGRNVLFVDDELNVRSTNDGVTIAKQITVKDAVEDSIISIIRGSSLKTNSEVGDGTSTSILLSRILLKEGFKLIDAGYNGMELAREFDRFGAVILEALEKQKLIVKDDKTLEQIATVSANNDPKIAKDIIKVVKTAGQDGMVFLEPNNKDQTDIIADTGFYVKAGLFDQQLRNDPGRFSATYNDIPVLVTDKRIYYPEEAETILKTVMMAGHKAVVVVARDFTGQSINTFIANHTQGVCKVLLVKDPDASDKDNSSLDDLAIYLNMPLITEKQGSLVNKLTMKDFTIVDKVFADMTKTIISAKKKVNAALSMHVTAIRSELEKKKDDKRLKARLASLTNGVVTVKIGAPTQIELIERIYRYEDALNATRTAMKDGYLVGGGVALNNCFDGRMHPADLVPMYRKFCEANIRQIAENSGQHADSIVNQITIESPKNFGFNAVNNKVEDLLKAGIIDPYRVTVMAITNALSIAKQIIGSNYIIVHDVDEEKK